MQCVFKKIKMKKKLLKLLATALLLLTITTSFSGFNKKIVTYNLPNPRAYITVPLEHEIQQEDTYYMYPFTGNTFLGFKEALAFRESQGKYSKINSLGYLGKYQFGLSTLKRFKIYNSYQFIKDAELQEDAFLALCSLNKWILKRDIKRSVGKKIKGIRITESGILAAAHLAGAGNVKKYLRSNGSEGFSDAYGTDIEHYLRKFANYDTSFVEAIKRPQL